MAEGGEQENTDSSGGYDKHWFIKKEIALQYICGKCYNVFRDPHQITVCGHQVCRSCLPNEVKKCPTCNRCVSPNEVFADEAARQKVAELLMKCRSKHCKWKGTLQEFEEKHKSECPFRLVKCNNAGCNDVITQDEMPKHLENECKYRKIYCPHCGHQATVADEETHYEEECVSIPVACPNNCGSEIPKNKIQNHVDNQCEKTLIDCAFVTLGCEDKVERGNLQRHEETMVYEHLSQASLAINNLRQEKKGMGDEITELRDMNSKLTENLCDLREREETRASQIESDLNEFKVEGSAKLDEVEKTAKKYFEVLWQAVQQSGDFQQILLHIDEQLETMKCATIPELQHSCVTNQTKTKTLVEKMIVAVYTKLSSALANLRHEMDSKLDTLRTSHEDECIKRSKYEAETAKEILQLQKDINKNASGLEKLSMDLTITKDEMKANFQRHSDLMQLDYDNLSHLVTKEKHGRENDFEQLRKEMTDLQLSSTSTGVLLWRVDNVELASSEASRKPKNIRYGRAFYSEPNGYVLRPKIFFNGARQKDRGFVSVFIQILKGQFDPILKWPFEKNIRLTIIEQNSEELQRNLEKVLLVTAKANELRNPTEEGSNSIGIFKFVSHSELRKGSYIVDGVMYMKIEVLGTIKRNGHSQTT